MDNINGRVDIGIDFLPVLGTRLESCFKKFGTCRKILLGFPYKPEPEQEPEFNFFSSPELPDNSYHLSKK